jgi:hypothetical protein
MACVPFRRGQKLLLFMAIFAHALLSLMSGYFMTLSFLSAWHGY